MELAPPLLHTYLVEGVQVALTHPVENRKKAMPLNNIQRFGNKLFLNTCMKPFRRAVLNYTIRVKSECKLDHMFLKNLKLL